MPACSRIRSPCTAGRSRAWLAMMTICAASSPTPSSMRWRTSSGSRTTGCATWTPTDLGGSPMPGERDEIMMRIALEEAGAASSWGDVPIGAVVTRDDEVLVRAANARERDRDPTAHAEVLALRSAAQRLSTWRLEGCKLYVPLERGAMCD